MVTPFGACPWAWRERKGLTKRKDLEAVQEGLLPLQEMSPLSLLEVKYVREDHIA